MRWAVGEEGFTSTGKVVTDPGFTVIMHWRAPDANEETPNVQQGKEYGIETNTITERETSPPGYLTESELITLMEKHGIGTYSYFLTTFPFM